MDEKLRGAVNERDGGSPLRALWVRRGVVRVVESGLFGGDERARGHAMSQGF